MADPKTSRGYRNRNPGNIDYTPRNRWQGQVGIETGGSPPRFAVFERHEFGIRALAMLLITYQDRHGLRTIRQIIGRWAPGSENDTAAYVRHVAELTGRSPTEALDMHSHGDLRPLVVAIITHELGSQPYPAAVIDEGLRMAGVPAPVVTVAEAARTGSGRGALTVGAAASAAAAAAPLLEALAALPQWTGVAVVVAVALLAAGWVIARRMDP